ncbi:MAG: hypothetical protein IJ266_02950, partial [Elusimicrobiaceae bacterium]|nr:hypothetical protein [Elusimicrobiaceae bacterium]
ETGKEDCSDLSFDDLNIDVPGTDSSFQGKYVKQTGYFVYNLAGMVAFPTAHYNPGKLNPAKINDTAELFACLYVDEDGNINCSYVGEDGAKICRHSGYPVGGEDNGYCW